MADKSGGQGWCRPSYPEGTDLQSVAVADLLLTHLHRDCVVVHFPIVSVLYITKDGQKSLWLLLRDIYVYLKPNNIKGN